MVLSVSQRNYLFKTCLSVCALSSQEMGTVNWITAQQIYMAGINRQTGSWRIAAPLSEVTWPTAACVYFTGVKRDLSLQTRGNTKQSVNV